MSDYFNKDEELVLNNSKFQPELIKAKENFLRKLNSEFGEHEQDEFLYKISGLESNFGKNTDHKVVQSGVHEGTSAIGKFGIMPNTVKDVVKKYKNRDVTDLGKILPNNVIISQLEQLKDLNEDQIKELMVKDPTIERTIARLLAKDIAFKQDNDPDRMAFNWFHGSNLTKNDITDDRLNKSVYVNKFRKLREQIRNNNKTKLPLK
jgi:hypothetical protein